MRRIKTPKNMPVGRTLAATKKLNLDCQACPISALGTNVVFGEGPRIARIMIVGEQPGDE